MLVLTLGGCVDLTGDGVNHVACLGDSNTSGAFLAPEESYPAQLAMALAGVRDWTGAPYTVANHGTNGQGAMDGAAFAAVAEAIAGGADTVVLAYGTADIIKDLGYFGQPGSRPNDAIFTAIVALRQQVLAGRRFPITATLPRIISGRNDPGEQALLDGRVNDLNARVRRLPFVVEFAGAVYPDDYVDPWHMGAGGNAMRAAGVFAFLRHGLE
jgi:lysophospholipase L1-like esterase